MFVRTFEHTHTHTHTHTHKRKCDTGTETETESNAVTQSTQVCVRFTCLHTTTESNAVSHRRGHYGWAEHEIFELLGKHVNVNAAFTLPFTFRPLLRAASLCFSRRPLDQTSLSPPLSLFLSLRATTTKKTNLDDSGDDAAMTTTTTTTTFLDNGQAKEPRRKGTGNSE